MKKIRIMIVTIGLSLSILIVVSVFSSKHFWKSTEEAATTPYQASVMNNAPVPSVHPAESQGVEGKVNPQVIQKEPQEMKPVTPAVTTVPQVQQAVPQAPQKSLPIATIAPPPNKEEPTPIAETPEPSGTVPSTTNEDPLSGETHVNLDQKQIEHVVAAWNQAVKDSNSMPPWQQKADNMLVAASNYLGTPYVFGSKVGQTASFDCSSFTKFLFAQEHIKLPRSSREQSLLGTDVPLSDLRQGDLIFFTTPARSKKEGLDHIGHVAIYAGDGLIVHTFRPGIGVTISELNGSWKKRVVEVRRVLV
ncbi:NlpC/P60 family protein [Paenibacillus alba]|uniref:NlpC/P60 family protein n=1 Tax=Paenibacillus alba TaxID=1197127 RepID=A0ABU6G0W3_9BACL|nr:NlpC/P60 family protein [Paenibacillus alba]MEC0227782.1 NlpC/P60 family protein [Paenibacillus alba]